MTQSLTELRKLAMGATRLVPPSEWLLAYVAFEGLDLPANDAVESYIAAASPSTILALLNALDRQNEALGLALSYLIKFEPPDSRAVSDEFVAMAAVHAFPDQPEEKAMDIIRSAKSALATIDAVGGKK